MKEEILIVGAGVAGLMLKNRLESLGYMPLLAEKEEHLRAEGAGLILGPNVMKIFQKIGLEENLKLHGNFLNTMKVLDEQGNKLSSLDFLGIMKQKGLATISIHRKDLHNILSDSINKDTILFSHKVTSIKKISDKYAVTFNDKYTKMFDRVFSTDGLFSTIRTELFPEIGFRHTTQGCWRFIIDFPDTLDSKMGYEMWGDQKRVGIIPLDNKKAYCFLVKTLEIDEERASFSQVVQFFESFEGPWNSIKNNLDPNTDFIYGELMDTEQISLEKDGIVFIGDSGHSTTPNLGQGAAMGIESAYILGELIKEYGIEEATKYYSDRRYAKVSSIKEKSFMIGKLAHAKSKIFQKIRNLLLKLVPKSASEKEYVSVVLDELK